MGTAGRALMCLAWWIGAGALPSFASDLPSRAAPPAYVAVPVSPWTFTATPYFWMTSVNGTSTVRGRITDVDATFTDIANHTQFTRTLFGAAGVVEARNGPTFLFADMFYQKIGIGANGAVSRQFTPHVAGTVGAALDLTFRMLVTQLGIGYEVARWSGPGLMGSTALDVYAGTRIWWQQADLSLSVVGTATVGDLTFSRGRAIAKSGDVSWADPVIGARIRHEFAPGTELSVTGDVGGFGAGSQFSWQAIGALKTDVYKTQNCTVGLLVGYRALYVDYEQGRGNTRYRYDMLEHGPLAGITARF